LSPWIEGGKFCGSRGMALPLLGLNVRLKGDAAKSHECSYFATFVDGSSVGPVPAGEACQADSLAALEAFQITLRRRGGAPALRPAVGRPGVAVAAPKPAIERPKVAAPAAKPAVERPRAAAPAPAGKPVAPTQKRGAPHVAPRSAPRR
jgi:hypothetical protein